MFYRLRTNLARRIFNAQISKILETPPLEPIPANFTVLSMVSHNDLMMYLLAIKSFYWSLRKGNILIVDDGSLTSQDKYILTTHLRKPRIVERKTIILGRFPRHIMWERLAYAVDLSATQYVIQLDADTLTKGPVQEVLDCIASNRAFTLGTRTGQTLVSVDEASIFAADRNQEEIQFKSETALSQLRGAEEFKYVRGSAGLAGLAHGGWSRGPTEDFFVQMMGLVGERFLEWGTDQVAFNFIVANSPKGVVLPYPAYACTSPELVSEARFLHFVGTWRFNGGTYAREGRRVIDALIRAGGR